MSENKYVQPVTNQRGEPTCTAPHPVVPFLLFVGTLVLAGAIAFFVLRFLF